MQLYNLFYKQFGIRRIQSLLNPTLLNIDNLPRNSLLHYLDLQQEHIDTSKSYLHGYTKRILVDFKDMLIGQKGAPKRKAIVLKSHIKEWLIHNTNFKWAPDHYKLINDPLTLLINQYNYLDVLYRYVDLPMTAYNKWWNIQDTIWSSINTIADNSDRHQFIFITIPDELPGFSILKLFSTRTTVAMLKIFNSNDKLTLLDFWKWLHPETRDLSVMNHISDKNLNKINIIFTNTQQQSIVVNLGYLNSWIKGQENTTEFSTIMQIQPEQLQKVILKSWMSCQSNITELLETNEVIEEDKREEVDKVEDQLLQEEQEEFEQEHETLDEEEDVSIADFTSKVKNTKEFKEVDQTSKVFDDYLKEVDEDISILDSINNKQLSDRGIKIDSKGEVETIKKPATIINLAKLVNHHTTEDSVLDMINEQAELGAITANEYKTLVKDIKNYQQMPDPYGSKQTIADMSVITEQDLALDDSKVTLADNPLVLDKGMLSSSLESFDKDYINNILHKDVVNMTGGIQRAGVVIKKHQVEIDSSMLGTYENHTLELKPIRGMSSIIRFRLPKIEEDGTFISSTNKYLLRKQRVD